MSKNIDENIIKGLQLVADFIVSELRKEFEAQGHNDTNTLTNSLEGVVEKTTNGYVISVLGVGYAKYLETGFGKGKWVSVYALMEWIERRGIETGEKEIKSAAFAIRRAIHDQGSPTNGAFSPKITSNGRRKEFITIVLDENAIIIFDKVAEVFATMTEGVITNAITVNKKYFENAQ